MFKGEIGHQQIMIGAAGSRYRSISDLTQPIQPMNHEIAQRPEQRTGNCTPYCLLKVCGFCSSRSLKHPHEDHFAMFQVTAEVVDINETRKKGVPRNTSLRKAMSLGLNNVDHC